MIGNTEQSHALGMAGWPSDRAFVNLTCFGRELSKEEEKEVEEEEIDEEEEVEKK